jgi:pyruvate carboxylase
MYPKVFSEFTAAVRKYGPVAALPTPIYFYGMKSGDEIGIEIERGKALVVRLLTMGETDAEGQVKVFFELNGQPRIARVPNRAASAKIVARRKAEDGNDSHIAAPMPGSVALVAVRQGQTVQEGDVVATLEAMKMETVLHAPRTGTVSEILIAPGQQVDARDLLMVIG